MDEMIVIEEAFLPEGRCAICNRTMLTRRTYKSQVHGLLEVQIKTAHRKCERLIERKRRLEQQLLNIDYELFTRRM